MIVETPVEKINPAKYNPRAISEESFQGLVSSVKRWGLPEPLVVNKVNNVLVSGHQRLRAATHLGMKTVPVVYVELTDAEEKALNVTLNNVKIQGYFTEGLQELLEEIKLELPEDFESLRLDDLVMDDWESDIEGTVDDIEESNETAPATIKITCPQDLKDEVLIYIKAKLLETSFEGVHVA